MKISKLILLACVWGSIVSCEDLLDPKLTNEWSSETVWTNPDMAQAVLTQVYADLMVVPDHYDDNFLDAATDNALTRNYGSSVYRASMGAFSRSTNPLGNWDNMYDKIQSINLFMEKGVTDDVIYNRVSKETDQAIKTRLLGEAYFLRAWCSFKLLQTYGGRTDEGEALGYTITNHFIGDKESAKPSLFKRNSYKDCVSQIVSDCEEAARRLPVTYTGDDVVVGKSKIGRACGLAANALKARTLLYAASPLFNEKPIESGNELIGYASYDRERWKIAADAARNFINTYGTGDGAIMGLDDNFKNVFTNWYSNEHKEVIFFRENAMDKTVETANGPLGLSGAKQGNGRTNPTQNLVDAFLMKDGHFINDKGKYEYNEQLPYAQRDPRLEYTIIHNGSSWVNSTMETWQGGANNPLGSSYSLTSYYMRKFMGDFEAANEYQDTQHNWVMFRYAEILLNFAEAENEYLSTPSQAVYDAIIALRRRAGIEPGEKNLYGLTTNEQTHNLTQAEMRKVIQNERRIELAFEEHRYWDIRRWRLAEQVYAQPIQGMYITKSQTSTTYVPQAVLNVQWDNKRYFYPIPYSEVIKNKNMVQNPNW